MEPAFAGRRIPIGTPTLFSFLDHKAEGISPQFEF
jgi:hypothetical protein